MKVSELPKNHYNNYYQTYIDTLQEVTLIDILKKQLVNFPKFIASIPEDKWHFAYEEGKWTIAGVLLHIIDVERVFQYRTLRFARMDNTPLPGFDQNMFAVHCNATKRNTPSIIEEYIAVRESTIALFNSFSNEDLMKVGVASDDNMSVAGAGFIICGHQRHHRNIIKERYL